MNARRSPDALVPSRAVLLLFALLAQNSLAREANFVALDGQHLDENLVAEFQLVADFPDALLGDLADVQQPVGAGKNFDEGAEVRQPHHLAEIGLADFG